MKIGNSALILIPVIFGLSMAYFYDKGSLSFNGFQSKLKSSDSAKVLVSDVSYGEELESILNLYEEIYQEESEKFENKITDKWGEYKSSSKDQWVSYVENGNIRRTVNYKTGEINVEMQLPNMAMVPKNVTNKMEKEIFGLLSSSEADAFLADEVAQNVEKRLPENHRMIKRGKPSENHLFDIDELSGISFNHSGFITVSSKTRYVAHTKVKKSALPGQVIVQSRLKIKKEVLRKAIQYADSVQQASKKQNISSALIYAIMESESSFNPLAKSHVPAYGLMQIVPRSAGLDATKHLYGRQKILAPSYLYSTDNNIKIGTAYLHVLYYKYLSRVKDPQSRVYCAIAAYNTGASNVARAFIKQKNFNRAVKRINNMSSDQVYKALVKRLPFRETRKYVKKVTKNMNKYIVVANGNHEVI